MKILNWEKLSQSNFNVRLLDFARDYEKATHVDLYDDVVDWIIFEKSDLISGFLQSEPLCDCTQELLDRKKKLYEEFLNSYEDEIVN